jgi:GT2 family glycosyltransferase
MAVTSAADLTVAICTRNRPGLLRRALQSVSAQTEPPAEILVVDNAPADAVTRTLVQVEFPGVRYVPEPVAGLDAARNRALRSATREVVALLDDDGVADPGWTGALAAAFRMHPKAGLCTGRVEPLSLETEAQRLFEANGGMPFPDSAIRLCLPADGRRLMGGRRAPAIAWALTAGCGCNLALRRELALALGGFDESLDLGSPLPGAGDSDMILRVIEAGAEVVCEPAALVRHEHRRELDAMHEQVIGYQRALVALAARAAARTPPARRLPVLAFLGWRLVKPAVRLARRAAGQDVLPARVLLRMLWEGWRGLVSYSPARQVARSRQEGA